MVLCIRFGIFIYFIDSTFWRVQSFKKHIKRQICLLCLMCFQTFPAVEFLRKKMKRSVGGWRISRMREKFPELGTTQYTSPRLNGNGTIHFPTFKRERHNSFPHVYTGTAQYIFSRLNGNGTVHFHTFKLDRHNSFPQASTH